MEAPDLLAASDRLIELETKLTFAEDLIDTLNQTVVRQQAQLDLLQEQLRMLHRQIEAVQAAEPHKPHEEIPPHY